MYLANSDFLSQNFAFSDVVDEFVDVVTLESAKIQRNGTIKQLYREAYGIIPFHTITFCPPTWSFTWAYMW